LSDLAPPPASLGDRLLAFFRSLRQFDRSFWAANVSELFERIAYYGMKAFLLLFLVKALAVDDVTASDIGAWFGLSVWGLAAISGFLADIMGYRRAMLLAYALLGSGYFILGYVSGTVPILLALVLVAFGTSLIKPSITGTVQKTCSPGQRALGFSIYYTLVNIGGAIGPALAGRIRSDAGESGPSLALTVSAGGIGVALLLILLLFREPPNEVGVERRRFRDFARDFRTVLGNGRFMLLVLLVSLYYSVFWQLYYGLPLYATNVLRVDDSTLGNLIAIESTTVVCLQVVVGYLVRNMKPLLATFAAVALTAASMAAIGIGVPIGLAIFVLAIGEIVYAAHFYRYLGSIAPSNQVGLYMGFAFLPIGLGDFFGGLFAGRLFTWCNETLKAPDVMWYCFAGIGAVAALGMLLLARGGEQQPAAPSK
jgi:MFS family permease